MSRKGAKEEPRLRAGRLQFEDQGMLECALTHISAMTAARTSAPKAISGWNSSATTCSAW